MRVSLPTQAVPLLEMMSSPAQAAGPAAVLLVLTQVPVQRPEAGERVPQAEPVWA